MSDLDQLRLDEEAARLRWDEAAARVRGGKTADEWRDELPEVRSFPFATDAEVEAEIKRVERIRPADLASVLQGRFSCPGDFLRLERELRDLNEKIDGLVGKEATAVARSAELRQRRKEVLWERRLAAGRALESYLAHLRNRGASPERVTRHIEDRVSEQTAAERAAWRAARDRLAAGEREFQERAVREARVARERQERATREAYGPWLRAMGVKTAFRSPALGALDLKMVREWAENNTRRYPGLSGCISARFAERVALNVYSELCGRAEDVSILQVVDSEDGRWRTADIIAGDGKWIDVKSARESFSSPMAYSEHCVPEMKMDRRGQDVIISAFLSPYVVYSESDTDAIDAPRDPLVWIGETSRSEFERLKQEFPLLNGGSRDALPSRLPPWLFDYPAESYSLRNEALTILRSPSFPWSGARLPTGAYILGGQVPPGRRREVAVESAELGDRIERMGLSRPVLFLHVLDRFCRAVGEGKPFPAKAFRDILWPSMAMPDPITLDDSLGIERCPLAVADPLQTVRELVDVLASVAQVCGTRSISFDEFKLAGVGIFKGRRRRGEWMTLFSYCGGRTRTSSGILVRCGRSPLFLGQDATCVSCGRLACAKCGYCGRECRECGPRQAAVT